ncbi:MAG: fimbrillin family protein, partial [Bacteroidales bacterium]|nr:fimbrillin family protein [Bacteroidales bacterium]
MKNSNYILLSGLILAAFACQRIEKPVNPTAGTEVQFGATLKTSVETKVIYGDEDATAGFPIYWIKGDKVFIHSPQAVEGRSSGVYKVKDEAFDNPDEGQKVDGQEWLYYAGELEKEGETGVQWGAAEKHDFYSIYPAGSLASSDDNSVTFTVNMPVEQTMNVNSSPVSGVYGAKPQMDGCLMYAKSTEVDNGATVDLKYVPYSTAIRFKLRGPSNGETDDYDDVSVQKVVLKAPFPIAGSFNATISNSGEALPSLAANSGATCDSVIVVPEVVGSSAYLTLAPGESVEMNAFITIPSDQTNPTVDGNWKIRIYLTDGTVFTKSLKAKEGTGSSLLVPGKIHRLPDLPTLNVAEWDASRWMAYLPDNVYLSEVSLPGSWYSLGSGYQVTTGSEGTLTDAEMILSQYEIGTRAFHFDMRWRASSLAAGTEGETTLDKLDGLAVLGRQPDVGPTVDGRRIEASGVASCEDMLDVIISQLNPDEYMVLVCTFAQGGTYDNPAYPWYKMLGDILAKPKYAETVIDGRLIDDKTVVGQVRGKVIVMACVQNSPIMDTPDARFVYAHAPLAGNTESYFGSTINTTPLKMGNNYSNGITLAFTHGQRTYQTTPGTSGSDYVPSIPQRTAMAGLILDESKANHSSSSSSS